MKLKAEQQLGDYRLLRQVGKNFGTQTWLAVDNGGRQACLEITRMEQLFRSQREQLLHKLEVMKSLYHPHLLPVFEAWIEQDQETPGAAGSGIELLVLATEAFEDTLEKRQPRLTPADAGALAKQFVGPAQALDYLHDQQLVHGRLDANNLPFVQDRLRLGVLDLADLMFGPDSTRPLSLCRLMAPETREVPYGPRCEQYVLAVLYAEARLNRPLYPVGKTVLATVNKHRTEPPNLAGLLPAEQQVLLRALAKQPQERFEHCTAFAQALQGAV